MTKPKKSQRNRGHQTAPAGIYNVPEALHGLLVPMAELHQDPRNARAHDQKKLDAIAASLRRFGQQKPIVADAAGQIVAGNGQYQAAQALGWTHLAAIRTNLAGPEQTAYALADNRTAELATWDNTVLKDLMDELAAQDASLLDAVGFGDDLAALLDPPAVPPSANIIPEPPDAATTQAGDLWTLGRHRLLCGSAALSADVDRLLAGAAIHLVNTDPPYNVRVEPRSNNAIAAGLSTFDGTHKRGHHQSFDVARQGEKKATGKMRAKDRPLENDFVTDQAFEQMLLDWFGQMARVLKPGRSFYIWGGYANVANYPPAMKACNLYFSQTIIWVKEHPVLTRKDFMGNHEWCFYGWKHDGPHWFAPGLNNLSDVWEVALADTAETCPGLGDGLTIQGPASQLYITAKIPKHKTRHVTVGQETPLTFHLDGPTDVWRVRKVTPQNMVHLTEKPVELATRAMHYSSRRGKNVLDLFGGSGSTLIAAEIAGRNAYLMELDALYCDVIVARWEAFTGQKAQREPAPAVET